MSSPITTSARTLSHLPLPLPHLTLIVATTPITTAPPSSPAPSSPAKTPRRLGIGHAGTLPWPRIKADMTFFSRVTTRAAPLPTPPSPDDATCAIGAVNAVIMGRKTYDSLPARFRPLPGRVNVVVTRDASGRERRRIEGEWRAAQERKRERARGGEKERGRRDRDKDERGGNIGGTIDAEAESEVGTTDAQPPDVLVADSLESAVSALCDAFRTAPTPGLLTRNSTRRLANVFIIGGGEVYASALKLKLDGWEAAAGKMRIVMTDVRRVSTPAPSPSNDATATTVDTTKAEEGERGGSTAVENCVNGFECDTFFPLDSDDLEEGGDGGWRRVTTEDVSIWVGEEVKEGWVREGEVALRVLGFERRV
ncbi:dihydrofolate reductase [Histoplasma capsulatum var. duboisii H88]|uniref:Dihydrofolate reductase n=2 Tax=Ajellomyces capsulatus (strain H88) TaxID=544711 RepID=F0U8J8_AJEC8|nr:dihydrofolate reductase [Histoplasma capsulatum var. duboisii H88]